MSYNQIWLTFSTFIQTYGEYIICHKVKFGSFWIIYPRRHVYRTYCLPLAANILNKNCFVNRCTSIYHADIYWHHCITYMLYIQYIFLIYMLFDSKRFFPLLYTTSLICLAMECGGLFPFLFSLSYVWQSSWEYFARIFSVPTAICYYIEYRLISI